VSAMVVPEPTTTGRGRFNTHASIASPTLRDATAWRTFLRAVITWWRAGRFSHVLSGRLVGEYAMAVGFCRSNGHGNRFQDGGFAGVTVSGRLIRYQCASSSKSEGRAARRPSTAAGDNRERRWLLPVHARSPW
jgi:hypothetical protein